MRADALLDGAEDRVALVAVHQPGRHLVCPVLQAFRDSRDPGPGGEPHPRDDFVAVILRARIRERDAWRSAEPGEAEVVEVHLVRITNAQRSIVVAGERRQYPRVRPWLGGACSRAALVQSSREAGREPVPCGRPVLNAVALAADE